MEEKSRREQEQEWMACPDCTTHSYDTVYKLALKRGHVRGQPINVAVLLPGVEPMVEHAGVAKRCATHAEAANG